MVRKGFAAAAVATFTAALFAVSAPVWSQPPAGGGRPPAAPAPVPTGKAPVVKIAGGEIEGVLFDDVAVYRGVPYAAAPVGDLRWRAPQPVAAWKGVREAAEFGKSCTAPPAGAEDCLYLNVYKPANAKAGAKLPVMFWIHGGGFTGGSGSQYDGSSFVKKGGVIYVSINYRMGRAGWFAHPAITKNAPKGEAVDNFGLMDQIAALKWVQANISAFGGDNKNVTVFGESAGGVSDMYLVSVEAAQGLFQKMIAESSFGLAPVFDPAQSEKVGADYFAAKGITGDSAATLEAMRKVAWADMQGGTKVGETQPIADGKLIKRDTGTAFSEGKEMKIPILLGGTSNEASLWPTADAVARIAKLELPADFDVNGAHDPKRMINTMTTDYFIGQADREMARWHTKNGAPTYRYYFSYLTPARRTPDSLGVPHGGEVGYVFGRNTADPQDAAMTEAIQAYWIAFAKTGDPGKAGGPAWPKYDMTSEAVMDFSSDGPVVRNHMFDARYDWIRERREKIGMTADPGIAPLMNSNPAHEGPRTWVVPAGKTVAGQ